MCNKSISIQTDKRHLTPMEIRKFLNCSLSFQIVRNFRHSSLNIIRGVSELFPQTLSNWSRRSFHGHWPFSFLWHYLFFITWWCNWCRDRFNEFNYIMTMTLRWLSTSPWRSLFLLSITIIMQVFEPCAISPPRLLYSFFHIFYSSGNNSDVHS